MVDVELLGSTELALASQVVNETVDQSDDHLDDMIGIMAKQALSGDSLSEDGS